MNAADQGGIVVPRRRGGEIVRKRARPDEEEQLDDCRGASECATECKARRRLKSTVAQPRANSGAGVAGTVQKKA